ncbi:MAG: fluoride efflux transporter CrcB [Tannerella sp.]|jgi:CrcB protein|nr:fluoride efflux transporter CrcB [Tannerella sp.]
MIRTLLLIGFGGGAGSILRYLTSVVTNKYFHGAFPLGTFIVNVAGCFVIGWLAGLFGRQPGYSDLRALFITGFCGGYTTFSTFSAENAQLFQSGNGSLAVVYIIASVLAGLAAVWVGMQAGRM